MSERAPSGASSQTPPTAEISVGTGAAYALANGHTRRPLRNVSEVRHFFRTNEVPIYFRRRDAVQPAGSGPMGPQLVLCHLPRRLGWRAPTRVHLHAKRYIEFESGKEINNCCWVNPRTPAITPTAGPLRSLPRTST